MARATGPAPASCYFAFQGAAVGIRRQEQPPEPPDERCGPGGRRPDSLQVAPGDRGQQAGPVAPVEPVADPARPAAAIRKAVADSPAAYDAATPLARGWGVETALTVGVLRAGLVVREVPCELQHRVSGSDWRGQLHRAGQYRDVWLALVRRGWRPWQRG